MATGHDLLTELIVDLIVPPIVTAVWLLFAYINNYIVDRRGKGSKVERNPWRLLIQTYLVVLVLTLVHLRAR
jgi:hypothetical protein